MDFLQGLTAQTTEIIILGGAFIACLILVFSLGRGRAVAFTLSFYPAAFFFFLLPFPEKLLVLKENPWQMFLNQVIIFALFFAVTFLIINKIASHGILYKSRRQFFKIVVLALGLWIIALTTFSQLLVLPQIEKYLVTTFKFFSSETLLFWLLIIPLAFILLFIRR